MTLANLSSYSKDDWHDAGKRAVLSQSGQHFIDGKLCASIGGEKLETINPANGETIADISAGTARDIDLAVASAQASFRSGVWAKMAPRDRMSVLYKFADLVEENAETLAVLDTLDMGKPIADMLEVDVPAVADTIRFMAEGIDKMEGRVTNTDASAMHFVLREPYGVVGAISPWNYPMLMAIWKVAPALAAGNSVVLKPAEQSPMSCPILAQLFVEAGGPEGVFNVVNGIGEVAGKALALHNDVAKVSFTGSTEVGKLMMQYSGQSNMKKVALECGGKSPQIFLSDLNDLESAVAAAYNGIFSNMGEVCNAGSRLLVDKKIYGDFVDQFVKEGESAYAPGDPLDPETNMGPLVTQEAQSRVLSLVEVGKSEGATLKFGGDVPAAFNRGAYVNPTLFTDVNNSMRIAKEEIFGPVASVIAFEGIEEAVAIANDTIYGLAAGIWTSDLNKAHRLIKDVEAGVIWVNTFDDGDFTQPFGGYKQSGNAKDNCFESLLSYTQTKSAWINLSE